MILKGQCTAEGAALGLHVPFKMCRVMARGDTHPAVFNSYRMQVQVLKMAILYVEPKQKGEIVSLSWIHRIIIDEIAGGVQNGFALIQFNALRGMIGMPPVEIRAEIEQLVCESPHGLRGYSPIRAHMGADDDKLCLAPRQVNDLSQSSSVGL